VFGRQHAAKACDALRGDGVRYAEVHEDGSATARLIPRDEFIEKGIKG